MDIKEINEKIEILEGNLQDLRVKTRDEDDFSLNRTYKKEIKYFESEIKRLQEQKKFLENSKTSKDSENTPYYRLQ